MVGHKQRRRRSVRRGAHTVEVVLVLPALFLFVFCGFEFGRANLVRNVASTAAYTGVREVIVAGATASEAQAAANEALGAVGVTGATVTVTPSTITPLTSSVHVDVSRPLQLGHRFRRKLLSARVCKSKGNAN